MKYIRTKDGRIFDTSEISVPYLVIGNWLDFNSQGRFEIIGQADAIEELCDEFMAINDFMDLPLFDSFENICLLLTTKKHKDDDVYGAIWLKEKNGAPTLKPVAKLNKKGELELL